MARVGMYCQSCGNAVSENLRYCNKCGARLGAAETIGTLSPGNFNLLIGAVVAIPFIGLAMIFILIAALDRGFGFRQDFVFGTIFLTFILLAIAEVGCFVMLLSRTRGPKASKTQDKERDPQLNAGVTRGLESPTFEPVPSVTEHTTRTLDPVRNADDKGK